MSIKIFSVLLALAIVAVACNNDAPQPQQPAETTTGTELPASPEGSMQTSLPQSPAPSATTPDPTALPGLNSTPAAAGEAPKINPAHGQPGHVCGIPVGSPLNGASAAGAAKPAQNPQPAAKTVTTSPAGAGAAVAPGTNPPHGQPGHSCAVPVGSPLPKQ